MATHEPTFEEVLDLAKRLPPRQKLRLIEAIVPDSRLLYNRPNPNHTHYVRSMDYGGI